MNLSIFHRPEIYALFLDEFRYPSSVNPQAEAYLTAPSMYKTSDMVNCTIKMTSVRDWKNTMSSGNEYGLPTKQNMIS